jgi:hypothetical protein
MLQFENFSAWVTVDDVELPQYSVEHSTDGKQVTAWIPSEAGKVECLIAIVSRPLNLTVSIKNFAVKWKDSIRSYATSGRVFVDGTHCGGRITYATKHRRLHNAIATKDYIRKSASTVRPFMFSQLELTGRCVITSSR